MQQIMPTLISDCVSITFGCCYPILQKDISASVDEKRLFMNLSNKFVKKQNYINLLESELSIFPFFVFIMLLTGKKWIFSYISYPEDMDCLLSAHVNVQRTEIVLNMCIILYKVI